MNLQDLLHTRQSNPLSELSNEKIKNLNRHLFDGLFFKSVLGVWGAIGTYLSKKVI